MEITADELKTQKKSGRANSTVNLPEKHAPKIILYRAIAEHLCCDLNGEAVILSLDNGKYYGVNELGARLWQLLQTSISQAELERLIMDEYEVEENVCRTAIDGFLEQMIAEGLIEPAYADAPPAELF